MKNFFSKHFTLLFVLIWLAFIALMAFHLPKAAAQETYVRIIQLGTGSTQYGRNLAPPGVGNHCLIGIDGSTVSPGLTSPGKVGCLTLGSGLTIDPVTGQLLAAGSPGPAGPPGASVTGPAGAKGDKGDPGASVTGPAGPANVLSIGSVSTLAPGSSATASLTGSAPNQTLSLGIPSGLTGVGVSGPANVMSIGTVTALPAGSSATATITGTAPAQTLNLGLPSGATGPVGATGPAGSPPVAVITGVTKSLNSCFQLSATRNAIVNYNADIVASLTLAGGQRGTLYLETFTDSGCTTGTSEIMHSTNGNTSGLAVALGNVSTQTLNVHGWVAAGLWAKLRTENNVGAPSFTAAKGQEVLQ